VPADPPWEDTASAICRPRRGASSETSRERPDLGLSSSTTVKKQTSVAEISQLVRGMLLW
jgi:hypothetical protein